MQEYPTIQHEIVRGVPVYAFDKLDGSNIRSEWSRKRGFYKFGARRRLVGEDDPLLGDAQLLILEKYEDSLIRVFRKQRWDKAVCFFEFWGPGSFAGNHAKEAHDVVLLDVAPNKESLLDPRTFRKLFDHAGIPELLHYGNANAEFEAAVRSGQLPGMTFEGVVCKAPRRDHPLMFKIKSRAWLERLRGHCGDDDALFESLK